jgi:hypothetical protein
LGGLALTMTIEEVGAATTSPSVGGEAAGLPSRSWVDGWWGGVGTGEKEAHDGQGA